MIKILNSIDITDILTEYHKLESGIQWTSMGHKGRQAGLQYKIENDHWNSQTQTINPETNQPWTKNEWASAVGRNRGMELDYNLLNPYFKDTIFEKLISDYKMYRTRFMWVNRMSCYSIHRDSTPRIHIPLITNPECYFVFKEGDTAKLTYMETGNVYWADTRNNHTFMNCSEMERLHLVGVVAE
jgi:hypothetical protein